MKQRNLLFASAATLALAFSACSDDLTVVNSPDGETVFTAQLPDGINSRAFNDGEKAKVLKYAVYEAGKKTVIYSSDQEDAPAATYNDMKFTLSLPLVNGQTYDLVFWAETEEWGEGATSPYTFTPSDQTIKISYDGIKCNDESRDAFFTSVTGFTVTGASQQSVKLYRPFAQLNIGTNDLEAAKRANIEPGTVQVAVKDIYNTLNLFSGEASNVENVVFDYAELPENETFPVEATPAYDYLAMNYLLTGEVPYDSDVNNAQKETKDVTISIMDKNKKEVNKFNLSAVPFQRNYRTNIYGALLTSTIDYTIEVKPGFNEPDNDNEVKEPQEPTKIDDTKYEVSTPAQMIYLAENPSMWKGKTIELTQDLNMGGYDWKPIGYNSENTDKNSMNWFEGTFDGKNHTISNVYCKTTGNYSVAGLFGALRGIVKNVKVSNSYFESNHYVGGIAAYSHNNNAATYGDGKSYPATGYSIENCQVLNSTLISRPTTTSTGTVENGDKVGGIIGYACSIMTLKNNRSQGNTIEGARGLGGLIGYASSGNNIPVTLDYNTVIGNQITQVYYDNYEKPNKDIMNRHGFYYGWTDGIEPTTTGNTPAIHSNNFFVKNMAPTTTEELELALRYAAEGSVIKVAEGTYEKFENTSALAMKTDGTGVKFTVKGAGKDKTTIKIGTYFFPKSDITFEDLTIDIEGKTYQGIANYTKGQFTNVKFLGELWTWGGEGVTYDNCEFDGTKHDDCYPVWVKLTANATFNNCTVKSSKGRAFLLCGDNDFNMFPEHNVTLNNVAITVVGDSKEKAAFEIHTEADADNITGIISLNKVSFDTDKFTGLWREINNNDDLGCPPTDFYRIVVDGTIVQTGR